MGKMRRWTAGATEDHRNTPNATLLRWSTAAPAGTPAEFQADVSNCQLRFPLLLLPAAVRVDIVADCGKYGGGRTARPLRDQAGPENKA